MKCPCCGEYNVIWIDHNEVTQDGIDSELWDESKTHQYCKNCDWGICDDC